MDFADWERACLGGALAPAVEQALKLAGLHYADDATAEAHLREAERLAPEHIAVQIGWYRFYFYKGRLSEALAVSENCLRRAADQLGLQRDWRQVERNATDFANYDAIAARFYLFALKGYAYLALRLGHGDLGQALVNKLLELDPSDKLNARVLQQVIDRRDAPDEDD